MLIGPYSPDRTFKKDKYAGTASNSRVNLMLKKDCISFTAKKDTDQDPHILDKMNKNVRFWVKLVCSCSNKASKVLEEFNTALKEVKEKSKKQLEQETQSQKADSKQMKALLNTIMYSILDRPDELFGFIVNNKPLREATINMINHTTPVAIGNINLANIGDGDLFTQLFKNAIELNLGASKFAQILADDEKFINNLPAQYREVVSGVLKELLDSGTPSRTLKEAQEEFNDLFGEGNVRVNKCLGIGTVAEIYEVKIKGTISTGRQQWETAVVKIIKKNLTPERIKAEEHFYKTLVETIFADKELAWYYSTIVQSLYEGWLEEINLENERKNAVSLANKPKHSRYNVAKIINVRTLSSEDSKRVLVMEKVEGLPLNQVIKYLQDYNNIIEKLKKDGMTVNNTIFSEAQKIIYPKYRKQIEKYPWLQFTKRIQETLCESYIKAISYHFYNSDEFKKSDHKTIHADLHSGNIFFNFYPDKKKPPLTFIDTGLGVTYDKKEFINNLIISFHTIIGDSKTIAKYLLKNAQIPSGSDKKELLEKIAKDLHNEIFSSDAEIDFDPSSQNKQMSVILKRYRIVPDRNDLLAVKACLQAFQTYKTITRLSGSEVARQVIINELFSGLKTIFKTSPKDSCQKFLPSLKLLMSNYDSKYNLLRWTVDK